MERYCVSMIFCFAGLAIAYSAADLRPLQDFCVAQQPVAVMANGLSCKDPGQVQASDFVSYGGLHIPGNASNYLRSKVTPVFATQIPGLNTLRISMARLDYAQWGVNPPHTHPRASEIFLVFIANAVVGSTPDMSADILAYAFQADKTIISQMQEKLNVTNRRAIV